jgi:zinc protease
MSLRAFRPVFITMMAILMGLVVWTESVKAGVFNPETATLENGLEIVVITNRRAPVVSHMVWYKVGAMDEPQGQSGLAHVLEHLMFKGTSRFPDGEFSRIISRNGGEENAFTSSDFTAYFQNVAKDRLDMVMGLEADRMTGLVLTPSVVEPELSVVLEERRTRVDNDPASQLRERAGAMMFLNHPYRRPIIGWEQEIADLDMDEILAFYRDWYAPNNAVLVVAGDVTLDDVLPLAQKHYGPIPAAELPDRINFAEPAPLTERRVTLSDPRVRQPSVSRSYHAPSYLHGETDQSYPLQVAARILGGGTTSRLYRELVIDQGLAIAAGAFYDPSRRGPSEFVVYASPRPGVSLAALERAMDEVLEEFSTDGPSEDETARAKKALQANAVYARDSLSAGAYVLGEAMVIGRPVDDVESWPERIEAVNTGAITEAMRSVLDKRGAVTALLSSVRNDEAEAIQ